MLLTRIGKKLDVILERVASIFYGIGSGILAVLMVFTFVDVALRYFFDSPIKGDNDLSSYMMAIVIPSGLALTALRKKHIKVDVFTQLLPVRAQLGLNTFGYLLGLGLIAFMVWQTAAYAASLIESGVTSTTIPSVPAYPFVIVCTICLVVFGLVLLRDLIHSARATVRGREEGDADVAD
ncbi:MAG: TRAP transporter small permease [Thermoleophilia bacterium]|nr:TRAP transporter small permease [Thermoleophilia bacterium]